MLDNLADLAQAGAIGYHLAEQESQAAQDAAVREWLASSRPKYKADCSRSVPKSRSSCCGQRQLLAYLIARRLRPPQCRPTSITCPMRQSASTRSACVPATRISAYARAAFSLSGSALSCTRSALFC